MPDMSEHNDTRSRLWNAVKDRVAGVPGAIRRAGDRTLEATENTKQLWDEGRALAKETY